MNNNQPDNSSNPNPDNSQWAEFVDQRNRSDSVGGPDGNARISGDPVERFDLNSDLLNDLELDGQLRMLGRISSSGDSFVDAVIAQTNPEAKQTLTNRPRLPVLKPSLGLGTSESTEEVAGRIPESGESDSTPVSSAGETTNPKSVARFAALAATVLVGCFLGSLWWFNSDQNITDSAISPSAISKTDPPEAITDPANELQKDRLEDGIEILPEDDIASTPFSANKALADQSNDKKVVGGSTGMTLEESEQQVWDRIFNGPYKANSNPTLVDVENKIDSAVEPANIGMPPFADAKNIEDQKVEISSTDGPIWDSKLDWNLDINFQKNGVGSVSLNGKPIQAVFLQDNAVFLLRQISSELQRRVQFMENRLGAEVNGSISVAGVDFRFDHISQLDETVESVNRHIATLNVRSPSLEELMILRAGYRQGIIANLNKFNSIDLAGKNLSFYTEDEAFTICSVLSSSEALLRDLATKRLAWEENKEIRSTDADRAITIAPRDFLLFAKSGVLHLPDPNFTTPSVASIQTLGPPVLMQILSGTPSVELFRNLQEFEEAKEYVYSNGPPEMKQRLAIDKIDRKLEEKNLADSFRDLLEGQKRRLVSELRQLKAQVKRVSDGVAMQPLKEVLAKRTDLHGLPLTMGTECLSDTDETRDLRQVSSLVGRTVSRFNGQLGSRDAAQNDAFRNLFIKQVVSYCMKDHADNPTSQKLKTIDQILQIDHPRLRLEMIDALGKSGTDAAVDVLVDKAKFDLEPEVRKAATEALADVAPNKYRGTLLAGLNYPWHVVAEHSAEALVRLRDQGAVPNLIDMLDLPHPQLPTESNGKLVQRELVGINHMRNCLLCHAPSISESDSVRGLIPHESRPLPPHYYGAAFGTTDVPFAVRADITYLEQDFSVVLPVDDPGPWPREQRIDFVVQEKRLSPAEAKQAARRIIQSPNRNRNAVIFALRQLTGETPADNSSNSWRSILAGRQGDGN